LNSYQSVHLGSYSGTNTSRPKTLYIDTLGKGSNALIYGEFDTGNVTINSNLFASGNITALAFIGDGSGLTGITGSMDTNLIRSQITNGLPVIAATRFIGGSIGVGTNSPAEAIHVVGNAKARLDGNTILDSKGEYLLYADYTSLKNGFLLGAGNSTLTGTYNLGIGGEDAGPSNGTLDSLTTGANNTGIGEMGVLTSLTTGYGNTAVGANSQSFNKVGTFNTSVGYMALANNVAMSANVAVGYLALTSLTNGHYNTAIGNSAGHLIENGQYNTIIGGDAIRDGHFVNETVAVGVDSFMKSTNGYNTGLGTYSFQFLNDGAKNTGLGYRAGTGFVNGGSNTIIGADNTIITNGEKNIIIGYGADGLLPANTSNTLSIGNLIFGTGLSSGTTISRGKIGIGTPGPVALLQVSNPVGSSGTSMLLVSTNDASNGFEVRSNGTAYVRGQQLATIGGATISGRVPIWNGGTELNSATGLTTDFSGNLVAKSITLSGTTNQVKFGGTNSPPADTATIRKWISVQVGTETNAYRLPLYE